MKQQDAKTATDFDRFKFLARNLVAVPKKEIDKKEAAYQRERAAKRRRNKPT